LGEFTRREVTAAPTLPTLATAPLGTEFTTPASATRLAAVVTPFITTTLAAIIAPATVVTIPSLARRFFVTDLRKFFRRCIAPSPGRAEVECGQQALCQLIGGIAHGADGSDRSGNDKPALRQSI
jgi:hypothetical protein